MSNQRQDQNKPETTQDKKNTDTTALLSAEELRAISGGMIAPPSVLPPANGSGPVVGGVKGVG